MTVRKAIDTLYECWGNKQLTEALMVAVEAMEKQDAKPPLQACGHALERFRESIPWMRYCPICGQKIDWDATGE